MGPLRPLRLVLVAATGLLAACGDSGGAALSPAARAQKEAAYRQACVAGILEQNAEDDLAMLEAATGAGSPGDPLAALNQRAAQAALAFGRAYHAHAQLRRTAYALSDSAVNRARTPADSARYATRAQAMAITLPAEGSVEANVITSYQQRMGELLANANHPCNWDFPWDD